MEKDMTKGNAIRLIIGFCIPMLFGNIVQQLYSMADSIIIGRYVGKAALAGVGSAGSLNFMVIGFAIGVCNGLCIKVAQSFGAKDFSLMRKYIANALYMCIGITVLLTAVSIGLTNWVLKVMDTPQDIFEYAYGYITIIFAGIIFVMIYNFLSCVLRAIGDSKSPLYFLIIAALLNIVLDLLFILALGWGAKGAAYATVISEAVSAILCFVYILRKYPILKVKGEEWRFDIKLCLSLIAVGIPMGLQISIVAIGALILQAAVNAMGTDAVAAITAYGKIEILAIEPLDAIGITMATYCAQNKGAGQYQRIRQGMRKALLLSMTYCLFAMFIVCVMGRYLVLLFVKKEEIQVLAYAGKALLIQGLAYPLLSILFIFRNALQGMGYSFLPMLGGAAELFGRAFVIFTFVGGYGFTAVCFASPAAWLGVDVLLLVTYAIKIKKLKIQLAQVQVGAA